MTRRLAYRSRRSRRRGSHVSSRTRQRWTQRMHRSRRRSNRLFDLSWRFNHRRSSFRSCGRLRTCRLRHRLRRFYHRSAMHRLFFHGDGRTAASATQAAAHFRGNVIVERARMRLLVHDTQLGQQLEDHVRLDLQLASELIDADFAHTMRPGRRYCRAGFLTAKPLLGNLRIHRVLYRNRFVFRL